MKKTTRRKERKNKLRKHSKHMSNTTYETCASPRIRVLIQHLDDSGRYSYKGRNYTILGASFDEVVETVRNALAEKYMTKISGTGRILFMPYSPNEPAGYKCPYCGAIKGFDPHAPNCPMHKLIMTHWINKDLQEM